MYLVTGASGFIGRYLIKRMREDGERIRILTRTDRIDDLAKDSSVEFFGGDLLKLETLVRATKDIGIVIHLAGITHTVNEKLYLQINVRGTENLVRACEKNTVKKIIYISSRAISPSGGAYSRSKLEAEKIIKKSSMDFTILRLAEVYGGNDDEGIERLIEMVLRLPIVPVVGNGNYRLQPVYVGDVADAIITVSKSDITTGKIYNIAGPDIYAFKDLVKLLCETLNLTRRIIHVPVAVALAGAYISSFFLRKTIIYPDQIFRLISPKEECIENAVKDFGYKPLGLKKGLGLILGKNGAKNTKK